jgi:competence protein ComEC
MLGLRVGGGAASSLAVFLVAYILGLACTAVPFGGGIALAMGAIAAAVALRWRWLSPLPWQHWLVAGILAALASGYYHLRQPYPGPTDLSRLLPASGSAEVIVQGQLESLPRLTSSQKFQLWLQVDQVKDIRTTQDPNLDLHQAKGRVYVTSQLLLAPDLTPGQQVEVKGLLYRPSAPRNPGGFSFRNYLAQEQSFAGLSAAELRVLPQVQTQTGWGKPLFQLWPQPWQIQQRIIEPQARGAGDEAGPLISAMVLGGKAVNLDPLVKAAFMQVGMAHALAASGYQTSLILSVLLSLTQRLGRKLQFIVGASGLLIFVGLAGAQPAVLRAALMGLGGLVGLVAQRKVKPLGMMLVVAVGLLLYQPLWIWDLGFALSFLATLGLLLTVPTLQAKLDWLPSFVAALVAVPIAAYLWTLPLQIYSFGVVSPYSVPVNILTTPLISVLSLGGMVSALGCLVWPPLGQGLSYPLKFVAEALIAVVQWFAALPGNGYAVGSISMAIVGLLYGLLLLYRRSSWWQRRWWLAIALALGCIGLPTWAAQAQQLRITVLAADGQPLVVVQDRGKTGLLAQQLDESLINYTLLPFLQKAGVNQITWAIAPNLLNENLLNEDRLNEPSPDPSRTESSPQPQSLRPKPDAPRASDPQEADQSQAEGWNLLNQRLPIRNLYSTGPANPIRPVNLSMLRPIPFQQPLTQGRVQFEFVDPTTLSFEVAGPTRQRWLWLSGQPPKARSLQPDILLWSGRKLQQIQPRRLGIALGKRPRPTNFRTYWPERDGAVIWTPKRGFRTPWQTPEI